MELAAKLQLKPNQSLKGVGTPHAVASELAELEAGANSQLESALLFFITDRAALEVHREQIVDAASKDHLTWVAYPKAGHLGTDLNRDSLAALLSESGVQPVRQVAINEVWSALRFRPGPRRSSPKDSQKPRTAPVRARTKPESV
ncbi:MAG: hypothetical protein ABSE75_04585 [Acidimicrobiales bacterium]